MSLSASLAQRGQPKNRIDRAFAACRAQGRAALIVYITAGYPDLDVTRRLISELFAAGADILEIGMPFSDPVADGPVIQRASEQALAQGTRLADVLAVLRRLRAEGLDKPCLLLSYANPLLANGLLDDPHPLVESGFDGLIVPDIPSVESGPLEARCREAGLHWIPLLAPTSPTEHIDRVVAGTGGFVYCVSVTGVTGAREALPASTINLLGRVRARAARPVAVGFGVSGPQQARMLAAHADGIIVGSAVVQRIAQAGGVVGGDPVAAAVQFVRELRMALD